MWIKHYLLNSNAKWKTLFQQLCKLEDYELDHKLSRNDLKCKTNFHIQVLDCWFKIKTKPPNNLNGIPNEYVFLNTFIFGNRSILPSHLGLRPSESLVNLKIKDLLNNNGKLMSSKDVMEKKKWKINIMYINSLLSAIPRFWTAEIEKIASEMPVPHSLGKYF